MTTVQSSTRVSWNQGRIVGPKPPLKPKHIWAIRTHLQHDGRIRDLAMFNPAIDSKPRGCFPPWPEMNMSQLRRKPDSPKRGRSR